MVVIVGLPYPAAKDDKVVEKMKFLDIIKHDGAGRQWYSCQAIRAVNQALGRVIRHKDDFGAVLLCDERYSNGGALNSMSMGLSSWLRPALGVYGSFGLAFQHCEGFFDRVAPCQARQRLASAAAEAE